MNHLPSMLQWERLHHADESLALEIASALAYFDGHILFGKEKIPAYEEMFSEAIIQDLTQKAIQKRGWDWAITYVGSYGVKWTAFIQPIKIVGAGDSPAAAILTAYMAAREEFFEEEYFRSHWGPV